MHILYFKKLHFMKIRLSAQGLNPLLQVLRIPKGYDSEKAISRVKQ